MGLRGKNNNNMALAAKGMLESYVVMCILAPLHLYATPSPLYLFLGGMSWVQGGPHPSILLS